MNSKFKRHLESLGIKLITSRIKHPQTNGKMEKLFDCYNRYRDDFESLDGFVYWYNNVRFHHESLDTKRYLQGCMWKLGLVSQPSCWRWRMGRSCISFSFDQEYFVMVSKIVLPVERFMFWTNITKKVFSIISD